MSSLKLFTIILAGIGAIFLMISIHASKEIIKAIPKDSLGRWQLLVALKISFLIGYFLFIISEVMDTPYSVELLVGLVFLGGAIFVFTITQFSKKTITDLNRSMATIENVLDTILPVCITGLDFKIIRANTAYYDIWANPELKNKEIKCYESRPGKLCHTAQCPLNQITGGNKKVVIESVKGKAEQTLEFIITARPFLDENNKMIGIIETFQDITNWNRAKRRKDQLESQLQQAYKMEAIGTLAGGIAHDFNNILGSIMGYTDMAKDDAPQDSSISRDLEMVLIAANRAKDLVKQILAFSHQSETERIPLQPAPLVQEAVKMLRSSIPTTIEIVQRIDPQCGVILADPTQFQQIVMNISTNAFHAMEEKGGILQITLEAAEFKGASFPGVGLLREGKHIKLTISDTGIGICPENLDKLFDPYFTTKEIGKGTGMGLAITHGIVESYDGFLDIETELGKGTSFYVYLPVIEENAAQTQADGPITGGTERILFVDDEEMLADMAKKMLEKLGYKVTARINSLEALRKFENDPDLFDLVITDQTMPGMTGLDLAKRILQIRPELPIILCTGYSNTISQAQTKALGIKEFTLKPLLQRDLARLIRKTLTAP